MPQSIKFLFRFRDLVAKTIDSHQEVINEKGNCWWGWWKRPSEDNRSEVWDELKAASQENPIAVGLFDSGNGWAYKALVTEIIPPGEHAELVATPEDRDRVPSYYRESPFSRAWMRLTKIERIHDFIDHYSFANAPALPNYRREVLNQFVGKKIVDASELRSMDTTIWEIRPAQPGDRSDEILLSTKALTEAVSSDVVQCQADCILHITDLHFAVGEGRRDQHVWTLESETTTTPPTLSGRLSGAIGERKIGAVIASGDFTFIGSQEEFDEARTALIKLLGLLDLSPDHLIVVPGNHDIQWTTDETYTPDKPIAAASEEARRNYERFYEQLFQHPPSSHLGMGRRWLLPSGVLLDIAALNSSSLQTGKNFLAGMGRIDETSFEDIRTKLGWQNSDDGSPKPTLALRLLVVHHHLAVTDDIEPATGYSQGYGMAVDAVRIQRLATKCRVQLALHGHKHRAFLWRSSVYELPEHTSTDYKLGEISIVGGGSAGSKETEGKRNYFNLLDFAAHELEVTMYRATAQGIFEKFKIFRAPVSRYQDGGLKLEDWIEKEWRA